MLYYETLDLILTFLLTWLSLTPLRQGEGAGTLSHDFQVGVVVQTPHSDFSLLPDEGGSAAPH